MVSFLQCFFGGAAKKVNESAAEKKQDSEKPTAVEKKQGNKSHDDCAECLEVRGTQRKLNKKDKKTTKRLGSSATNKSSKTTNSSLSTRYGTGLVGTGSFHSLAGDVNSCSPKVSPSLCKSSSRSPRREQTEDRLAKTLSLDKSARRCCASDNTTKLDKSARKLEKSASRGGRDQDHQSRQFRALETLLALQRFLAQRDHHHHGPSSASPAEFAELEILLQQNHATMCPADFAELQVLLDAMLLSKSALNNTSTGFNASTGEPIHTIQATPASCPTSCPVSSYYNQPNHRRRRAAHNHGRKVEVEKKEKTCPGRCDEFDASLTYEDICRLSVCSVPTDQESSSTEFSTQDSFVSCQ